MTPNPNTMKYVANTPLVPEGITLELGAGDDLSNYPLVARLFSFPFVERIFITGNFVTITKTAAIEWDDVTMELREYIVNYLTSGNPVVLNPEKLIPKSAEDVPDEDESPIENFTHVLPQNEIEAKIVEILEEYIQPAVENDGGAIHFKSFDIEKGQLAVTLKGSCNGCPSSTATLKHGIENLFANMLPQVKQVVAEA